MPVVALSSIAPFGGIICCIDIVVCRVFDVVYVDADRVVLSALQQDRAHADWIVLSR